MCITACMRKGLFMEEKSHLIKKDGATVFLRDYFDKFLDDYANIYEIKYCRDDIEECYNIIFKMIVSDDFHHNTYDCIFYNVSLLRLNGLSNFLNLNDIEILDNHNNGYADGMRYYLSDFENDSISFYFEKIDVIKTTA